MESIRVNLESLLAVGTAVVFHTDPNRKDSPRLPSIIRGWHKPSQITVDRPRAMSGSFAMMYENQRCVARYVLEGKACAFDTQVIDWDTRPHNPYMRVTWPKEIHYVSFRKSERIKFTAPCSLVQGKNTWQGEIRDLSIGGCGLWTGVALKLGTNILASFELPDGTRVESVEALIRNVTETSRGYSLGCEFTPGQDYVENDIAFFFTTALGRSGKDDSPRFVVRVLILDDDKATGIALKQRFEERGYEVFLSTNTVDGLYRLRAVLPAALLVSQNFGEVPGLEICRLVKLSRDVGALPVFVYGGVEKDFADRARAAGAANSFRPGAGMDEIAAAVGAAIANTSAERG